MLEEKGFTEVDRLKQEKSLLQDKVKDLEVTICNLKADLEWASRKPQRIERNKSKPIIRKASLGGR